MSIIKYISHPAQNSTEEPILALHSTVIDIVYPTAKTIHEVATFNHVERIRDDFLEQQWPYHGSD